MLSGSASINCCIICDAMLVYGHFQAHKLGEKIHDIDFATLDVKTVSEVGLL